MFNPLGRDQLHRIVRIQLERTRALLTQRGIELRVSDEAVELITDRGFDPVYGARPLKRSIQKNLVDPLANEILAGTFVSGDVVRAEVAQVGVTNGDQVGGIRTHGDERRLMFTKVEAVAGGEAA